MNIDSSKSGHIQANFTRLTAGSTNKNASMYIEIMKYQCVKCKIYIQRQVIKGRMSENDMQRVNSESQTGHKRAGHTGSQSPTWKTGWVWGAVATCTSTDAKHVSYTSNRIAHAIADLSIMSMIRHTNWCKFSPLSLNQWIRVHHWACKMTRALRINSAR